jgi:hypothetical protein
MVSIFQPRFPTQPSPAGATVATTTFPTELAPFIKDILEKSKAQQEGAAYQAYTGPQLAQFTDAERAAMEAMRQQTTGLAGTDVAQATPYFTGAKTAAEGLGKQFTGDTAQQFMNPYQQAVVDQAKRKAVEDYERNIAPAVTAQAIAQQPFGGSRQAISEAMAREGLADRLTDIQERGLASAFDKGRAAFEAQKGRELQQAQQLTQLGQTIPQQALRDLAVQQQLGEQERQQEQLALDLSKGQFMEEREFPTRALQEYSAIVRGFPFQPSTYQTSTQYQATPSVANQLLQLGGAGMGAYTQFTGKPLGNLFGMANQGGGIADIVSNQMGENDQISIKARNDYIESARGDAVEHLNRYGVGGTKRREVEDLLPSDLLPEEVAPFRTDEVMTESAVGAPMGGPLPSREEIDMMEKNRLLQEEQMRKMFNQGGLISLPTVYRFAGNPEEENESEDTQQVLGFKAAPISEITGESILSAVPEKITGITDSTESLAQNYDELLNKLGGTENLPEEAAAAIGYLSAPDKFKSEAYDRIVSPEGTIFKAKEKEQDKLSEIADPESEYSKDLAKRRVSQRAAIEGSGLVDTALSLDPNASFIQNLSQLIGGTGKAVGAARTEFDKFVEADTAKQLDAAAGIVASETNYLDLMRQTEANVLKGSEQEINKHLGTLDQLVNLKRNDGLLVGDLLKLKTNAQLELIDRKIQAAQTDIQRNNLILERDKLLNDVKYNQVISGIEGYKAKKDAEYKMGSLQKDYAKIEADYKATMADLEEKRIFDAADSIKILQVVGKQFGLEYDANGALLGGKIENEREAQAFDDALAFAMSRAADNKKNRLPIVDAGFIEGVKQNRQTRSYGLAPLVYGALNKNQSIDAIKTGYENYKGTRAEYTQSFLTNKNNAIYMKDYDSNTKASKIFNELRKRFKVI